MALVVGAKRVSLIRTAVAAPTVTLSTLAKLPPLVMFSCSKPVHSPCGPVAVKLPWTAVVESAPKAVAALTLTVSTPETTFPGPTAVGLIAPRPVPLPVMLKMLPVIPGLAFMVSPGVHVAPAPPRVPFTVVLFWLITTVSLPGVRLITTPPGVNSPCSRVCAGNAPSAAPVVYCPVATSISAFATDPVTTFGLKVFVGSLVLVEKTVWRLAVV